MAYLDGSGSGELKALHFHAFAVAYLYSALPVSPAEGALVPALAEDLKVLVNSSELTNTDMQIEVSDADDFSSLVFSSTLTNLADGFVTVGISGLVDLTDYYWRVRAAETGTTSWSAWSPTFTFRVWLDAGKAWGYIELNVGIAPRTTQPELQYIEENIGVEPVPRPPAMMYVDANFYQALVNTREAHGYIEMGDVSTDTPSPHIWFLRPTSGRAGEGIEVVGFGFGDLQGTYDGVLEERLTLDGGWQAVPVTGWQTFPETPDAYGADRELNPENGHIDMQHTVIEFTVQPTAAPPGVFIRVRTNGA